MSNTANIALDFNTPVNLWFETNYPDTGVATVIAKLNYNRTHIVMPFKFTDVEPDNITIAKKTDLFDSQDQAITRRLLWQKHPNTKFGKKLKHWVELKPGKSTIWQATTLTQFDTWEQIKFLVKTKRFYVQLLNN